MPGGKQRRVDETFITFPYQDIFEYPDDTGRFVCLSQRDVTILLSCLTPASWGSRWIDSSVNIGYPGNLLRNRGMDNELKQALEYVNELYWRLIMADCGQLIKEGLQEVATALAGISISQTVNCGCGGGGPGTPGGAGTGGAGTTGEEPTDPVDINGDPPPRL